MHYRSLWYGTSILARLWCFLLNQNCWKNRYLIIHLVRMYLPVQWFEQHLRPFCLPALFLFLWLNLNNIWWAENIQILFFLYTLNSVRGMQVPCRYPGRCQRICSNWATARTLHFPGYMIKRISYGACLSIERVTLWVSCAICTVAIKRVTPSSTKSANRTREPRCIEPDQSTVWLYKIPNFFAGCTANQW